MDGLDVVDEVLRRALGEPHPLVVLLLIVAGLLLERLELAVKIATRENHIDPKAVESKQRKTGVIVDCLVSFSRHAVRDLLVVSTPIGYRSVQNYNTL